MNKQKLIGYVGTRDLGKVTQADAQGLDIINIAFGHVKANKVVWEAGYAEEENIKVALKRLKVINPELKILLSIGGWSAGGFSEAAATEETRSLFTQTALDVMNHFELDGLDLDWEYPSFSVAGIKGCQADKKNFTELLKILREALDQLRDKDYMLTIAAGGGAYYLRGVEMQKAAQYLDYVQLMTYDLRGGFQVLTGHHTSLYEAEVDLFEGSVDTAVKVFHEAGVPLEKLVIGAAFYSRMWKGVPDVDQGLIQMAQTVGTYGPDYGTLVKEYIDKNGYIRYWDDVAKAPYLFNGETFISYDDEVSIGEKIEYMKHKGLAGIMYWEYKCDTTQTLTAWMAKQIKN